ncbi:methyl-accepting chemotaxis protein [Catenovulum agarivorans]|uniref:methyl-accepting chemotaxis protein n=1 Tax=Catenovulum agarivorans TaxID=1172192 RepID=UPI00031DAB2F|nr:methyl-accepting chemotaxis protein [Catenovulum agarivorans]
MRRNQHTIDKEVLVQANEELVSTTDLRGVITYANEAFIRVSGFTKEELIGKNHNLVRHPDMPKQAFADMWQKLQAGRSWRGIVKNRCKQGEYYWVDAFVTPIQQGGKVTGYQSVRTRPEPTHKQKAQTFYQSLQRGAGNKFAFNFKHKLIGAVASSLLLLALLAHLASTTAALLTAGLIILLLGIFYQELFVMPNKLNQLKSSRDDVTREILYGSSDAGLLEHIMAFEKSRNNTVIGRFNDLTYTLDNVVSDLKNLIEQANSNTQEQNFQLSQVAAAMNELSASAQEIANNTSSTASTVGDIQRDCANADQILMDNAKEMQQLSDMVHTAAESADTLKEQAEKVQQVMDEISSIAEQTNLLALNAAIESARAGEHGRGFAVVADEVRALSSRTQHSASTIQTSIQSMYQTIESWLATMHKSEQQALHCNGKAAEASQLVDHITKMIDEISTLSIQIATAATQQGAACEQINVNIQAVDGLSSESLTLVSKLDDDAVQLSNTTEYIHSMAQTFKV